MDVPCGDISVLIKKKKEKEKKALAHLVTGERGRRGADRMKYHLVGLNDNFISHLTS